MCNQNKEYKFVSLNEAKLVGKGHRSIVYRYSEDKVVKVYNEGFATEMIEKKFELSQKFEKAGLPVVKSYEIVNTEGGLGIVFDYFEGSGLGEYIHKHPEKMETLIKRFAEILRQINSIDQDIKTVFPSTKERFRIAIDNLKGNHFTRYDIKSLHQILDSIPDETTLLHGDWQTQNVMINDKEEIFIIDVDDAGYGHPLFDVGGFYMTVFTLEETPENAMLINAMEVEEVRKAWSIFLPAYYQTEDKDLLEQVQQACNYFGMFRMVELYNDNIGLKPIELFMLSNIVRARVIFKKADVIKKFSALK